MTAKGREAVKREVRERKRETALLELCKKKKKRCVGEKSQDTEKDGKQERGEGGVCTEEGIFIDC